VIYYAYSELNKEFVDECKVLLKEKKVTFVTFSSMADIDLSSASHLLVTGCLVEIKVLMDIACKSEISLGIIPLPKQKELMRTFALPSNLSEAVELALEPGEKKIDVLYCNETLVLQEVVVGDAPPLDEFDTTLKGKSIFDRVKMFWNIIKKVRQLRHSKMTITSGKESEVKISAVGIVGVEYTNATFASRLISSSLSANDGKFSIVILAPQSIMQYMRYLFKSLISHLVPKTLPKSVGHIRSRKINIETEKPLNVLIDSSQKQKTPISLEVKEKALALSLGETFWEKHSEERSEKDIVKVDHLPSDEESKSYLSEAIPLFSHASQEQYATLFKNLREESKTTTTFIMLLIFSTILATFGLFINSSSVIIGAMLLAPLMQPIVSLSMGALRQDNSLQINGAKSIAWGVLVVLLTAALIAFLTPIEKLTTEMAGRLSPTILDLFIAIVSGAAAAYAKSNEKILGSLAGVAIAVALVPPIAVAGIGIGWADWHMFLTAFLLFITNLVGIVLAAALTFVSLGFSPLHVAKKGIMIWMIIVAVVAMPLYSSFSKMQEDIEIQTTLSNLEFSLGSHDVKLTDIELIHRPKKDEIRCEVISTGILTQEEKGLLKAAILSSINKEAEVIVTFRYRL